MALSPADLPPRIAAKVTVRADGCWEWTATVSGGYGSVWWQGRHRVAHRVVWELLVGPIPGEPRRTVLDHLCRRRTCVNPAHLQVVSQSVNTRRGNTHRRFRGIR